MTAPMVRYLHARVVLTKCFNSFNQVFFVAVYSKHSCFFWRSKKYFVSLNFLFLFWIIFFMVFSVLFNVFVFSLKTWTNSQQISCHERLFVIITRLIDIYLSKKNGWYRHFTWNAEPPCRKRYQQNH